MANLDNDTRRAVLLFLLRSRHGDKFAPGTIGNAARKFQCHGNTITAIWKRHNAAIADGDITGCVDSRIKQNSGRTTRLNRDELMTNLKRVPLLHRSTVRAVAGQLGISVGFVHSLLQEGVVVWHSNTAKPKLNSDKRMERLSFCTSFVDDTHHFVAMMDVVHIDEKWFNHDKAKRAFYLAKDEEAPTRQLTSARFIDKSMFLVAVARPRCDYHTKRDFDGKIGCWPMVKLHTAQRSSKNRLKGAVVLKNIESVDGAVCKHYVLEYLLPAIKERMPLRCKGRTFYIQQDNARPHVDPNDPDILEPCKSDGWDIQFRNQPANSPDLNLLDLVFFASIQSIQYTHTIKNTTELVRIVCTTFENMSSDTLNKVFLTLQAVMQEVLKCRGSNSYKLPHCQKQIARRGELPERLPCEEDPYKMALRILAKEEPLDPPRNADADQQASHASDAGTLERLQPVKTNCWSFAVKYTI